ncbi:MAG: amidinotransferase [Planctomycetes bacterium]|nr:amidinotransferase [Planctomycetota bacterium]
MTPTARILMCPPDHFGIHYEINPWMRRERPADAEAAAEQWSALCAALRAAGAELALLDPVPGLPDLVFTANAALVFRERAFVSRFRHAERRGEESVDAEWFASNGFEVERLPDTLFFEGAGDALFCGDTLYAGYRIRSDIQAHQWIARRIDRRVIPLELVDPYYYHLDTCFCPLTSSAALYFPPAFDAYARTALVEQIPTLIEVEPDEARRFACNAVVVGRTVVTNTGCPRLHARLRAEGFEAVETPLDEFVKSGGSAKCLTLRLDGEESTRT